MTVSREVELEGHIIDSGMMGTGFSIVMDLGGWSSYDAIEPYLAAPTEENIIDSMRDVAL
mgnify:CR=1 FL=1